jgi:hypothetical protein
MLGRLDISMIGPPVGVAVVPRIREGEAFRITIMALTENLAAATPTSMRYRIDDLNQGSAILDWTSLTPATSVNVVITAAQNAIRNCGYVERRQIVVEASDADGPIRNTMEYDIQDLRGIT